VNSTEFHHSVLQTLFPSTGPVMLIKKKVANYQWYNYTFNNLPLYFKKFTLMHK